MEIQLQCGQDHLTIGQAVVTRKYRSMTGRPKVCICIYMLRELTVYLGIVVSEVK